MMKYINDKLKNRMYLSKNDFMNCKMWFEKNDNNNDNNPDENNKENYLFHNLRSSVISLSNNRNSFNNYLNEISIKDKKLKRSSRIFPHTNNFNIFLNKEISEEKKLKELLFNVNKNEEELIDFIDFMKRNNIKKAPKRKKSTHFFGISENKSNIDKADILSQNSFLESADKTQLSESTTNYFKGSKNLMANNTLNNPTMNSKDEPKVKRVKSHKRQKFNETLRDFSEEKINNNINEIINFPIIYLKNLRPIIF